MRNPVIYFRKIYKKHVEKIYRFIYIKVNSQQTAEDLTSEVFLRFWQTIKKNNPAKIKDPKAFLYKTARNLVIDHYRAGQKFKEISVEEIKEKELINKEIIETNKEILLEIEVILQALKKLKEEYQDVLLWYYLDQLSVEEIAKILNKSQNSVRVMIHRAMEKLREILQNSLKKV